MSYVWSVVHLVFYVVFFFKQKTAYEMRISDWSSDVCSSDLLRFEAQVYLFQNLVPNAGMEVSDQIATFVENARSMTGIGTLALLVTALLLLSTINGAFNAIWRVTEPRPLMIRLMAYWMILTISPLLLGASLSLTSYGFVSAVMVQSERAFGLTRLLPFLFAIGGFTLT